MRDEYPYLLDAAKQLEAAARRVRKAADTQTSMTKTALWLLLSEAQSNIDAAVARIAFTDTEKE